MTALPGWDDSLHKDDIELISEMLQNWLFDVYGETWIIKILLKTPWMADTRILFVMINLTRPLQWESSLDRIRQNGFSFPVKNPAPPPPTPIPPARYSSFWTTPWNTDPLPLLQKRRFAWNLLFVCAETRSPHSLLWYGGWCGSYLTGIGCSVILLPLHTDIALITFYSMSGFTTALAYFLLLLLLFCSIVSRLEAQLTEITMLSKMQSSVQSCTCIRNWSHP